MRVLRLKLLERIRSAKEQALKKFDDDELALAKYKDDINKCDADIAAAAFALLAKAKPSDVFVDTNWASWGGQFYISVKVKPSGRLRGAIKAKREVERAHSHGIPRLIPTYWEGQKTYTERRLELAETFDADIRLLLMSNDEYVTLTAKNDLAKYI